MIAKMKSFERVGQEQPAGEAALAEARAERPPSASARKPWTLWKPRAERVRPRVEPGRMRSIW